MLYNVLHTRHAPPSSGWPHAAQPQQHLSVPPSQFRTIILSSHRQYGRPEIGIETCYPQRVSSRMEGSGCTLDRQSASSIDKLTSNRGRHTTTTVIAAVDWANANVARKIAV